MEMKDFLVSIVVPNFNGKEFLEKCLTNIFEAKNFSKNNILEVIVVDDGSTDESTKIIREKFPTVKLIKHKFNRGFVASVNTGVRSSKGNLIALLNNDVYCEKDFLEAALKDFKDPKVFAVSLHEKGYSWAKGGWSEGYIQISEGKETKTVHESFYVSGGSGVFRRKIWMELGGMDEKLLSPYYWEDVDICFRASKRGYINLWEPDSHVLHKHESTIGKLGRSKKTLIQERNRLLVVWKNIMSPSLLRRHIARLLTRTLRHPGYVRVLLMALGKLGSVLKARRREVKVSRVSDETIFSRFSN